MTQYNLIVMMIVFGVVGFIVHTWLGALIGLVIGVLVHISEQLKTLIEKIDGA